MLVVVGLKRPEREDDRRSRSFFGGSTWWGPAELALWQGRHDEAGAAGAEGLRWCAERDPDRTLLQRTSRWYALALRLEADRAERAAARRAPEEVAEARRRATPVLTTLDRLAGAPTPQSRYPWVAGQLLLARAEQSRLEGRSDPRAVADGRPPPGSGWSTPSRPPTRVSGRPRRSWPEARSANKPRPCSGQRTRRRWRSGRNRCGTRSSCSLSAVASASKNRSTQPRHRKRRPRRPPR